MEGKRNDVRASAARQHEDHPPALFPLARANDARAFANLRRKLDVRSETSRHAEVERALRAHHRCAQTRAKRILLMRDLRPRVALEAGETSRQIELDEDIAAPVVAPSVGDAVRGLHLARFGAPRTRRLGPSGMQTLREGVSTLFPRPEARDLPTGKRTPGSSSSSSSSSSDDVKTEGSSKLRLRTMTRARRTR